MTEKSLALSDCTKTIGLDAWDDWECQVGKWQLAGGLGQDVVPEIPEIEEKDTPFAGGDLFIAGRCTAFLQGPKRPSSAPVARSRQSSESSRSSAFEPVAMSMTHSASHACFSGEKSFMQSSVRTNGIDGCNQASAQQSLRESLILHSAKDLRLRLRAMGERSKERAVPRTRMPLRPDPSVPSSLTPRSVLALEASIAQGALRLKRLQGLMKRKSAEKDDTSFEEQVAEADALKELLAQISGSLTLGKAAEAEVYHFQKELHNTKVALVNHERRQRALAATNAQLKEEKYLASAQAGQGREPKGSQQQTSRKRPSSSTSTVPSSRKLQGHETRDDKLRNVLKNLEDSTGRMAKFALADLSRNKAQEPNRRLTKKGGMMFRSDIEEVTHRLTVTSTTRSSEIRKSCVKNQGGCGDYQGKCRHTATAEGLQRTLLELLRQRERISQYRDTSVASQREKSKQVEALRNELNSVEF